jgi:hypothetical protein
MQAMRCLIDLFGQMPVHSQPYLSAIKSALGRVPDDEMMLLVNVVRAFGEAVDEIDPEESQPLLGILCEAFGNAGLTDPMLIGALEALIALLPTVVSEIERVIAAISEKVLIGIRQSIDAIWALDGLAFVNTVARIEPTHIIIVAAAECVGEQIRVSDCEGLMVECWGYLSHLIRNFPQVFAQFTEPVIAFVLDITELSSPVLSNIACVLFELLKVIELSNDQAQHILDLMITGLNGEPEEGDVQNIGCCIVRVIGGHPKLQCQVELLSKLIPYLTAIPNQTIVSELTHLINGYISHWPELSAALS